MATTDKGGVAPTDSKKLQSLSTTKKKKKERKEGVLTCASPLEIEPKGAPQHGESTDAKREGVEMLDTPDGTPRNADMKGYNTISPESLQARMEEAVIKTLDFSAEESRLKESDKAFVPVQGSKVIELKAILGKEKDRVKSVENLKVAKKSKDILAPIERQKRLRAEEEHKAAREIQRLYRGFKGRRRASNLQAAKAKAWQQVNDSVTGEIWWYNSMTGETWCDGEGSPFPGGPPQEPSPSNDPNSLMRRPSSTGSLPRVPSHGFSGNSRLSSSPLQLSSSRPMTAAWSQQIDGPIENSRNLPQLNHKPTTKRSPSKESPEEEYSAYNSAGFYDDNIETSTTLAEAFRQEDADSDSSDDESSGLSGTIYGDPMFLPDGTKNLKLRDTISNALRRSQFESVSTLLSSKIGRQHLSGGSVDTNSPTASSSMKKRSGISSPVQTLHRTSSMPNTGSVSPIKNGGPRMVSIIKISTKRDPYEPPTKTIALSSKDPHAEMFSKHHSPVIRNITHVGMSLHDDTSPQISDPNKEALSGDTIQDPNGPKKVREVCFNCWSAGKGKECDIHNKGNILRKVDLKDSAMACSNWDIKVFYRKYRAEEIQELFMKRMSSLRWDSGHSQFVSVVEAKHPLYRAIEQMLQLFNHKKILKRRLKNWFRSVYEQIKADNVAEAEGTRVPVMLRLRNTLLNNTHCVCYTNGVKDKHQPKPTITDAEIVDSQLLNWGKILPGPIPVPTSLYQPRQYSEPRQVITEIPSCYIPPLDNNKSINVIMNTKDPASWLERIASTVAAANNIKCDLQLEKASDIGRRNGIKYRTKVAPLLTKDSSIFTRKSRPPKNFAVGGLPAEVLLLQEIRTKVPPAYGYLYAIDIQSHSPIRIKDYFASDFVNTTPDCLIPPWTVRMLVSILDSRLFPSIITSSIIQENDCFYYGKNRKEQTGESLFTGYQTSNWVTPFLQDPSIDSIAFLPSDTIAIANLAVTRPTVTTNADSSYPFAIPTTKENTQLDYFHLQTKVDATSNDTCIFTAVVRQDPGNYGKKDDWDSPVAGVSIQIYRSFGYSQTGEIEKHKDRYGNPFWYNRRTGETFWEPPPSNEVLADDEDGLFRTERVDDDYDTRQAHKYSESQFRKYMASTHKINLQRAKLKDLRDDEQKAERIMTEKELIKKAKSKVYEPSLPKDMNVEKRQVAKSKKRATPQTQGVSSPKATTKQSSSPRVLNSVTYKIARGQVSAQGDLTSRSTEEYMDPTPRAGSVHGKGASNKPFTPVPRLNISRASNVNTRESHHPSTSGATFASIDNKPGSPNKKTREGRKNTARIDDKQGLSNNMSHNADLVASLTAALGQLLPTINEQASMMTDQKQLLGIGIGLGLGLGLQQNGLKYGSSSQAYRDIFTAGGKSTTDGDDCELFQESDDANISSRSLIDNETERSVRSLGSDDSYNPPASYKDIPLDDMPDDLLVEHGAFKEHVTHKIAGEGALFNKLDKKDPTTKLVKAKANLPDGFMASVYTTHTGKQHADYLPYIPNTNQAKSLDAVQPRKMLEDWNAKNFDPWFNVCDHTNADMVDSLESEADRARKNAQEESADGSKIDITDLKGMTEAQRLTTQAAKEKALLDSLFSACRHGQYEKVEEILDDDEIKLHIDTKDDSGNTLLLVAAQNNNKRIVKLALRRGANINEQNLSGQTALHYCFSYGFEDTASYILSKGGDDTILNAEKLTCYEGLSLQRVENL